jgi:hypothetical protein
MKIPTKPETALLLEKIRENPRLVQGLTEIQFHEVKKMIEGQIKTGAGIATKPMLTENPLNEQQLKKLENIFVTPHRDFLQQIERIWNDRNEPKIPDAEEEILFQDWIEKIVLMYEVGFFDFMRKKYGEHTPKKMYQLVHQLIGIHPETVKKYLQRIEKERLNPKSEIFNHFDKAKIQIGQVKPTSDILK